MLSASHENESSIGDDDECGGIGVAIFLRRDARAQLKVLYTTGYAENSIIHNGRLDQGITMVNKPYRRAELLEKVRTTLDET